MQCVSAYIQTDIGECKGWRDYYRTRIHMKIFLSPFCVCLQLESIQGYCLCIIFSAYALCQVQDLSHVCSNAGIAKRFQLNSTYQIASVFICKKNRII
jgi:hypothetical protein